MKYTLVLILTLVSFFGMGAKHLDLIFIDGYTNLPLTSQEVTFSLFKDAKMESYITDGQGGVRIEKFLKKQVFLSAKVSGTNFHPIHPWMNTNIPEERELKVYFYPTSEYEKLMFALEDSLYGTVDYNDTLPSLPVIPAIPAVESDSNNVSAHYPNGGARKMQMFINYNINYPQGSIVRNEQGRCYLKFVVEEDGKISHVVIFKSGGKEIDMEAKRVLRAMPQWIPGKHEGERVRTRCSLPINFTLG